MVTKHYKPTQQQRDRWREAMRNWQDVECINKVFYDGIAAHMKTLEKPTVLDALKEMYRKGNEPYFKEFSSYLNQDKIESPFAAKISERDAYHQVFHLWSRLGHTPEQEQWVVPLEMAELFMKGIVDYPEGLKDTQEKDSEVYKQIDMVYHHEPHRILPANSRQSAVYFAEAVYLLQKVQAFNRQGLAKAPYEKQRAFAKAYGEGDDQKVEHRAAACNIKLKMPYEMIVMTPQEKEAITGVATGLLEPEQTPYPRRMHMLKQVLLAADMQCDMKPWAARAYKNHTVRDPEERPFNPEQFKAARERRSAVTRD